MPSHLLEFEITSVHFTEHGTTEEHIVRLCCHGGEKPLTFGRQQVVQDVQNKLAAFYVREPGTGRKVYLDVIEHRDTPAFVKAHADGRWNDLLRELEICDGRCGVGPKGS